MTRRDFLRISGSVAAATASVDIALAQQQQPMHIGSGEHTYEVHHDWLVPPAELAFGDTHGLAQDRKGRIYVAHTVHPSSLSKNAVCVFDKHGRFLTSWGERFAGGAHGLDIRREKGSEYLYHCDTAHHVVVKTDLNGNVLWERGMPVESNVYKDKMAFTPTNTAFAPNGDFFVADGYGSSFIHQYDIRGNYRRTFGGIGDAPGKVNCPHGLYVDKRNKEPLLAVADRGNHRIQYFDLDGKHVRFATEGMRQPCHFDMRGDLLLVPDLSSVVTLLDKNNKVVAQLGDGNPTNLRGRPRTEYLPGKFIHPHDAIFLRNGDILVAEWVPRGRITLLKKVKG